MHFTLTKFTGGSLSDPRALGTYEVVEMGLSVA